MDTNATYYVSRFLSWPELGDFEFELDFAFASRSMYSLMFMHSSQTFMFVQLHLCKTLSLCLCLPPLSLSFSSCGQSTYELTHSVDLDRCIRVEIYIRNDFDLR